MQITMVSSCENCGDIELLNTTSGIKVTNAVTCVKLVLYKQRRRLTMEIIIDCDNKGLAKAMADALSKQTGMTEINLRRVAMMWILVWMQLVTNQG